MAIRINKLLSELNIGLATLESMPNALAKKNMTLQLTQKYLIK